MARNYYGKNNVRNNYNNQNDYDDRPRRRRNVIGGSIFGIKFEADIDEVIDSVREYSEEREEYRTYRQRRTLKYQQENEKLLSEMSNNSRNTKYLENSYDDDEDYE
jgi:hypothetical protein